MYTVSIMLFICDGKVKHKSCMYQSVDRSFSVHTDQQCVVTCAVWALTSSFRENWPLLYDRYVFRSRVSDDFCSSSDKEQLFKRKFFEKILGSNLEPFGAVNHGRIHVY